MLVYNMNEKNNNFDNIPEQFSKYIEKREQPSYNNLYRSNAEQKSADFKKNSISNSDMAFMLFVFLMMR